MFELDSRKIVKLDATKAAEFLNLNDKYTRSLSEDWVTRLQKTMKSNNFIGDQLSVATVTVGDKTYLLNGKHSSYAVAGLQTYSTDVWHLHYRADDGGLKEFLRK